MRKYSCIIIEDEPLLAEVLADYVNQTPFLDLQKVFGDGISAMEWLSHKKIDLVFIDINLPKLKGIDFIKMFQGSCKFIITTAYHEYALEGYTLNVIDYLLKPIEFNRFLMAVNKIRFEEKTETDPAGDKAGSKDYLYININKRRVKVNFSEILYVEGMKEYIKIYTEKAKWYITKMQMGQISELLNEQFVRIHRSYIVAKPRITSYNLTEVSIGDIILPVGTNYKGSLPGQLE
ncbi:MAG TPA: response regulator transcription factor [Chitinophagaceae bacterium]|jgi:DNA-binding LytR/AlgR family response regulator|nr:response regulator transcription factor [Chitinophagaceae bacterium]